MSNHFLIYVNIIIWTHELCSTFYVNLADLKFECYKLQFAHDVRFKNRKTDKLKTCLNVKLVFISTTLIASCDKTIWFMVLLSFSMKFTGFVA